VGLNALARVRLTPPKLKVCAFQKSHLRVERTGARIGTGEETVDVRGDHVAGHESSEDAVRLPYLVERQPFQFMVCHLVLRAEEQGSVARSCR